MSAARFVVPFDTETALIAPAHLAPELVCVTWESITPTGIVSPAQIAHVSTAYPHLKEWLEDPAVLFVGHNVAYDFGVVAERFPDLLPLIFEAYANDRVTDTKIRQQLLDIAAGMFRGRLVDGNRWIPHNYALEDLARRCAGMELKKDAMRLSYGRFLDVPLDRWIERAREVQAEAVARVAELERRPHAGSSPEEKALKKEIEGLREMIASDPSRCFEYPLDDARATGAVYRAQAKHAEFLADQYRQTRAAWWLHLSSAWGVRTDAEAVARLREQTMRSIDYLQADLQEAGLVRADGSRDTKAAAARMVEVCRAGGFPLRRTASHTRDCPADEHGDSVCHVSLDADACNAVEDETLAAYAEISTAKKVLSTDLEMLAAGTTYPIHTRYDIAETGRATSSKPNIMNLRRASKARRPCIIHEDCKANEALGLACAAAALQDIRECFVPRPGTVFAQADYPQLELFTLAQCCWSWLGFSKLGEALNRGLDPHLAMAANILGISYDEAKANKKRADVDNARQTAKVANFGFPGGLGVEKLILFAKKAYGVTLTFESATRLKQQWFETWPEMPRYFARINGLMDEDVGRAVVESLFTQRLRGGATYCAAANNGFQGLGSDCAKESGWLITRAAYTQSESALYGARVVAFVHDEFILEVPDDARASDAAFELARLMTVGANRYLPDVPIPLAKMEPLLMRRWSKKAEQVKDTSGRLVPWG